MVSYITKIIPLNKEINEKFYNIGRQSKRKKNPGCFSCAECLHEHDKKAKDAGWQTVFQDSIHKNIEEHSEPVNTLVTHFSEHLFIKSEEKLLFLRHTTMETEHTKTHGV